MKTKQTIISVLSVGFFVASAAACKGSSEDAFLFGRQKAPKTASPTDPSNFDAPKDPVGASVVAAQETGATEAEAPAVTTGSDQAATTVYGHGDTHQNPDKHWWNLWGILGRGDSEQADTDRLLSATDGKNLGKKGQVTVLSSEWEETVAAARKCQAEFTTFRQNADAEKRVEFSRGQKECSERQKHEQEEYAAKVVETATKILDEAKAKIASYVMSSAIINGTCEAEMTNGSMRFAKLVNECVNVVNKKVGNDGEVSGLIGAVSPRALQQGVASLNCNIGKAQIRLIGKKCDQQVSTGAAATKIETTEAK